jgi:GntR family transcriptional regulator
MLLQRRPPLAKSVARILRQRLRHAYANGGRLPSEPDIATELGVSRGTVRQALAILEREGAVFRRQGSGTYVNPYLLHIQARVEMAHEFTDLIRQAGYEAGIRLVSAARQPLPEDFAAALAVAPSAEALMVNKLFTADEHPAIFCTDMVPVELIREPYTEAELAAPIFQFLDRRCFQNISHVLADILPQVAGDAIGPLLEMAPDSPLLRFDEVGFNTLNKPVLFSRVYYRDQYIRFSVLRKKM